MRRRRRLIWQLYPSYLLLVLAVLLVTGGYGVRTMRLFHMNQVHQDLRHQSVLLTPQMQSLLASRQWEALDALCKQLGRAIPSRITVVMPDGIVVADSEADPSLMENHSHRGEIVAALQGREGTARRFSGTLNQHMMYLAVPLGHVETAGVLRLAIPLTAVEDQMRALQWRIALGGAVIAVLASLVCLIISRRISRPIEEMRKGAARFATGDLSRRLTPPDTVELSSLARAMNQMAEELERRIESIVRQRQETEAVLASMMEGVVALDRQERILHLNAAAASLFKGDGQDFQGRSILEVIRSRELHRLIQQTLLEGKAGSKDIVLYQAGEQVLFTRSTPLMDAGEKQVGVLLVMNDVTHLRRLETMRTDFAANVSHEIKTPLTAIQGFVETLAQGSVTNPREAQRFLAIIHKHVRRLVVIIDDLMQLACLERSGRLEKTRLQTVVIGQLLRAAVQVCRNSAEEKRIAIDIDCPETLSAPMDERLMEQAVVNLLDNAIKYSPPDSRVTVLAEMGAREIQMRFQDQGIGIPPKHLPRLFERFYRVDMARSRHMGGSGLGLSIVKHIIQAHGGQVVVESIEGQGSTFTIHLPT